VFRVIRLQLIAIIIAVTLAGLLAGGRGSISAAIGGGAVLLPNFLFALRLMAASAKRAGVTAAGLFIVYEFLKLALTLVLLAVAIALYVDLNWPSMLLSMAITLQVNFLALAKRT
jgi:ATP synthase protein I